MARRTPAAAPAAPAPGTLVGYARCSTDRQDLAAQLRSVLGVNDRAAYDEVVARLDEVFTICDTVTVMRDGAVVHDARIAMLAVPFSVLTPVSAGSVAPDLASGRLVAPFGFVHRTSRFVFLRPADRPSAAIDAFRDWLVAEGAATAQPEPFATPSTDPGV